MRYCFRELLPHKELNQNVSISVHLEHSVTKSDLSTLHSVTHAHLESIALDLEIPYLLVIVLQVLLLSQLL